MEATLLVCDGLIAVATCVYELETLPEIDDIFSIFDYTAVARRVEVSHFYTRSHTTIESALIFCNVIHNYISPDIPKYKDKYGAKDFAPRVAMR